MNWPLLVPLLVTTAVAVVGWYAVHRLQAARDRANKKRELRVSYLIEAYRRLESVCHRPPMGHADAAKIESAVADIQLFGSIRQVELVHQFVKEYAAEKNAEIEDLLNELRSELRKELGLPPYHGRTAFLRVNWDDETSAVSR